MKFELNPPKDEKNPEPIMRLELRDRDGNVDVVAINEDGTTFYLLTLFSDGAFRRYPNIDENSGFKTNKHGQITECKYF